MRQVQQYQLMTPPLRENQGVAKAKKPSDHLWQAFQSLVEACDRTEIGAPAFPASSVRISTASPTLWHFEGIYPWSSRVARGGPGALHWGRPFGGSEQSLARVGFDWVLARLLLNEWACCVSRAKVRDGGCPHLPRKPPLLDLCREGPSNHVINTHVTFLQE